MTTSRRAVLRGGALGAIAGVAGCLELGSTPRWPTFRSEGNNRASTRLDPGGELAIAWTVDLRDALGGYDGELLASSPVADESTAYVACRLAGASMGTGLVAVDVDTAEVRWSRRIEHDLTGRERLVPPPVVADELVTVLGSTRGFTLDRSDGRTRFEFGLPWVPTTAPGADRFLIALGGPAIAMIDLEEDRGVRWTYPLFEDEVQPHNPPTVLDDRLYVPIGRELMSMRRGDGVVLWREPLPDGAAVAGAPPLVDGYHFHQRLRTETGTDQLVALGRADREYRWSVDLGTATGERLDMLAYRSGQLVAAVEGELTTVFVGSGDRAWSVPTDVEGRYPTVGGDTVFHLGDSTIETYDRRDGDRLGSLDLPGRPAPMPNEVVPREDIALISRATRLIGLG